MTEPHSHLTKLYNDLSTPTFFTKNLHSTPRSLTTNILIVGGSYSGLSTLRAIQLHLSKRLNETDPTKRKKISITLIEPRNGLLNILGIPKCLTDIEFADTQFIPSINCQIANFPIFSAIPFHNTIKMIHGLRITQTVCSNLIIFKAKYAT